MKRVILFLLAIHVYFMGQAQQLDIQFINNSPISGSTEGNVLDIYINDSLYNSSSNIPYLAASPSISIAQAQGTRIGIAAAGSSAPNESFAIFNINQLEAGERYTFVIHGTFGDPDNPLRLERASGQKLFSTIDNGTSIRFFNGIFSNDSVRVSQQRGTEDFMLNRRNFSSYLDVDPSIQYWDFHQGDQLLGSYQLDLRSFEDQAITALISGTIDGLPSSQLILVKNDGEVLNLAPILLPELVINEVDYNQPGTDQSEFIELYNAGLTAVNLANTQIELWNGSTNTIYDLIDLPDLSVANQDYFVVCFNQSVPNCDWFFDGSLQNGGSTPDGIILSKEGSVIDALAYEGNLPGLTEGTSVALTDDNTPFTGLSRIPNGMDSNNNDEDFTSACITPGMPNIDSLGCSAPQVPDSTLLQFFNNYNNQSLDFYLNGILLASGISYQTATTFLKVPATAGNNISLVPEGAGISASIMNFEEITFTMDAAYFAVAEGNVDSGIEFVLKDGIRVEGSTSFATDFLVYHGLSSANAVDIRLREVGLVAEQLVYQRFSDYNSALIGSYLLNVLSSESQTILQTFEIDLSNTLGQALTLVISEDLSGEDGFVIVGVSADGQVFPLEVVKFGQAQLINNIPGITLDIYSDDLLIADNLAYQKASPFIDMRANQNLTISIREGESSPASPASISFENIRFEANEHKVMILNGDGTLDRPVDLFVLEDAQVLAGADNQITLATFHGALDLPQISILENGETSFATALDYGTFQTYQNLNMLNTQLTVLEGEAGPRIGVFAEDLNRFAGQAAVLFSSGVRSGAEGFSLHIAFPDGTVRPLSKIEFAALQIIHNSPIEQVVDVYINDVEFATNLSYQEASAFLEVAAEQTSSLQIVVAGAEDLSNPLLEVENLSFGLGDTYQIFINGSPDNETYPLRIFLNDMALQQASTDFASVSNLFNGALASEPIDLSVKGASSLFTSIDYGEFSSYTTILDDHINLELKDNSSQEIIATYSVDLSDLMPSSALTLFTSGDLSLGGKPELLAVLGDGSVRKFESVTFGSFQFINLVAEEAVDVYLNDEKIADALAYRAALPYLDIEAGRSHTIAVSAAGSTDASSAYDNIDDLEVNEGQLAGVIASGMGIVGARRVQLYTNLEAQREAGGDNKFAFNFFQGAYDVEELDFRIQNITTLHRNVSYGSFTDYSLIEPLSSDPRVTFEIKQSGGPLLAIFDADFSAYDNLGITLFGSGNLINRVIPSYALWIALPNGQTLPLDLVTSTQQFSKILSPTSVYPNPNKGHFQIEFYLQKRSEIQIEVINTLGKVVIQQTQGSLGQGRHLVALNGDNNLLPGTYFVRVEAEDGIRVTKIQVH